MEENKTSFLDILKEKYRKYSEESKDENLQSVNNWYQDRYQWMVVQRNLMFVIMVACVTLIFFLTFVVYSVKSSKSIDPFVIEIEPKTGVPTVIDPLSKIIYTQDEAVKRYFVWKYIQLREEFFHQTYKYQRNMVYLMSTQDVFSQYVRTVDDSVPTSPINKFGLNTSLRIALKSMVFQDENRAQVRVKFNIEGASSGSSDRIILIQFKFESLQMSDEKRRENPLGFTVELYKIDDERV